MMPERRDGIPEGESSFIRLKYYKMRYKRYAVKPISLRVHVSVNCFTLLLYNFTHFACHLLPKLSM